ncbi:MerR family transcriptional regulator [Alphaproteobacteria bacterium 46_93_T64]|nr:MerR family transcriptional regulator [Alphaproteobacteria bacterium 46_93_T64]
MKILEKYTLDIGDVVKRSGLPASTLRFYEEKGLIKSVGRNGLRRIFDANVLDQLAIIALGRSAGFSLDENADMFTDRVPKIDRKQLLGKAEQLDKTIKQLAAMRDGLRHAADCSAPSHIECPKFQRLLRAANNQQIKRRSRPSAK